MAKEQGISLTLQKLLVCVVDCAAVYYMNMSITWQQEGLRKRGKKVSTPRGDGKVTHVHPLTLSVTVDIIKEGKSEFSRDEIEPWNELEALRRKAAEPCKKEGNGNGCGKKPN